MGNINEREARRERQTQEQRGAEQTVQQQASGAPATQQETAGTAADVQQGEASAEAGQAIGATASAVQEGELGAQALDPKQGRPIERFEREKTPEPQPGPSSAGATGPYEGPSRSTRDPKQLDSHLIAEISGFVYHEPELIKHINNTMLELCKTAEGIKDAEANIKESTDDLLFTYNQTSNLFKNRGYADQTVERAVRKLEENIQLQDLVSQGFITAAKNVHTSVARLKTQIDKITLPVMGRDAH